MWENDFINLLNFYVITFENLVVIKVSRSKLIQIMIEKNRSRYSLKRGEFVFLKLKLINVG